MEYVRSLAERSDFIGGIDNEALDFDHLDRYMQTVPSVRSHSESNTDTSDPIALQSGAGATLIDNVNLTPVTAIESSFAKTATDHHDHSPDNVYRPVDLRGLRLITVPSDDGAELSKTINEVNETDPKKDCYTSFNDHPIAGDIAENLPIDNLTKPVRLSTTPEELSNLNGLHLYHNSALISTNHFRHHDHHDQQPPANESVLFRTDSIPEQIAGEKETEILPKKHGNISPSTHFNPEQATLHPVVIGASLESLEEIAIFDGDCNTSQSHLLNLDSSQTNSMETPGVIPEQYTAGESLSNSISATEMITSNTLSYKRKRKFDSNNSSDIKPEPDTSTYPSFNSPSTCQRQQRFQQRTQPLKNVPSIDPPQSLPDSNLDLNQQNLVVPDTSTLQCIRFAPFDEQNWHVLCDQYLKSMPIPNYRVDADKGFNFSNADDAFVCQKKNHFQITCHIQLQGEGKFVRTRTGLEKIKFFQLHFYGVKLEAPTHKIRVEQSQSDRSKKPFHPVPIDLEKGVVRKVTVGRLHFSETTSNNMRKKGRPNPEQRYFQLVVSLHAHTNSTSYPLISHGSERIIVRASNPGQFDSDVELCWQHGINDSIYHVGHVGINTDRPDESLVVHGNLKISGHIVQPSDFRAKQKIHELDPAKQLNNLQKIRIVQYQYHPEFAVHSGLRGTQMNCVNDIGVIAQEVQKVIPDAVQEAGNVVLPSGRVIENFLLVNKDRIFMESVGAIKELYRINENLQKRLELLERNKLFTHNQNSDRLIRNILLIWIILLAVWITTVLSLYTIENRRKPNQFNYTNLIDQTFTNNINTFNCDHIKYPESSIKKLLIDLSIEYKCCYNHHQKDHEICPSVFTTQYHSNQTYHYLHLESLLSRKLRYLLPS